MKKTKIAELKNRLSYYLERVKRGETVLVLDRNTPVARLTPVEVSAKMGPDEEEAWLQSLEVKGVIRRGKIRRKSDPEILKPPPGKTPVGAVQALIEDRRSR